MTGFTPKEVVPAMPALLAISDRQTPDGSSPSHLFDRSASIGPALTTFALGWDDKQNIYIYILPQGSLAVREDRLLFGKERARPPWPRHFHTLRGKSMATASTSGMH